MLDYSRSRKELHGLSVNECFAQFQIEIAKFNNLNLHVFVNLIVLSSLQICRLSKLYTDGRQR
jgi:hypothetical protein